MLKPEHPPLLCPRRGRGGGTTGGGQNDFGRAHRPGPEAGRAVPGAAGGTAGRVPAGGQQVGERPFLYLKT